MCQLVQCLQPSSDGWVGPKGSLHFHTSPTVVSTLQVPGGT